MRLIDIDCIKNKRVIKNFEKLEQAHLVSMQGMNAKERKKYINKNNDWQQLYKVLYDLSHGKCWYSEAPIGANEYDIDHFRPKCKAKQENGEVNLKDGYWYLAYWWRNYRLCGNLLNLRRDDKLKEVRDIGGKADLFPLENGCVPATRKLDLNKELPVLLDPTDDFDVTLITFDKKGIPIPSTNTPCERNRVYMSIKIYHLDLGQLNTARQKIWNDCETEIEDLNEQLNNSPCEDTKRAICRKAIKNLKKHVKAKAPFSQAAKACISSNANRSKYKHWLKNMIPAIL